MKRSGSAADDSDSDEEFDFSELMGRLCKDSITKMGNVKNLSDRKNMYNNCNNSNSSNTVLCTPLNTKSPTSSRSNSTNKSSGRSSTDGNIGSSASKSDLGMTISGENANHRPPRLTKKKKSSLSL